MILNTYKAMLYMFKSVIEEVAAWFEAFIRFLPGRLGSALRCLWYKWRCQECGKLHAEIGCELIGHNSIKLHGTTFISSYCYFNADGSSIVVGNNTSFNRGVHINAADGGKIVIGDNCLIGPGVVMRTAGHKYSRSDRIIRDQGHDIADIVIENDVWVGANAVILGGVLIGMGAVVGAGAVVTKDVPPMAIVVGVPATVIKYRGQEKIGE